MLYEPMAQLLERHQDEIVRLAVQTIITRKIPVYSTFKPDQLAKNLLPTVEMAVAYLRDGDVNKWRDFVSKTNEPLRAKGFAIEDITSVGKILVEMSLVVMERELPGPANAANREKYQRRLEGLLSLASISALHTHRKSASK